MLAWQESPVKHKHTVEAGQSPSICYICSKFVLRNLERISNNLEIAQNQITPAPSQEVHDDSPPPHTKQSGSPSFPAGPRPAWCVLVVTVPVGVRLLPGGPPKYTLLSPPRGPQDVSALRSFLLTHTSFLFLTHFPASTAVRVNELSARSQRHQAQRSKTKTTRNERSEGERLNMLNEPLCHGLV